MTFEKGLKEEMFGWLVALHIFKVKVDLGLSLKAKVENNVLE